MAEYYEGICSVKEILYYEEVPAPVAGVITPIYSTNNEELSTTSQSWQFSSNLAIPVVIPGASLPSGKKFLIFYHVAYGSETVEVGEEIVDGVGAFYLVTGNGDYDYGRGEGEGLSNAAAVPKSMRCSSGQSFFIHDGDGTDLEFAYRSENGAGVWFKGMSLISVPLDDDTSPLTEGTDYWYEQFNGLLPPTDPITVTQAEGWTEIVSKAMTTTASGEYICLASAEINIDKGDIGGVRADLVLAGQSNIQKTEMNRYSPDSRNTHPFTCISKVNLPGVASVNLKVEGAAISTAPVVFYTARVIILRAAFFDQVHHVKSFYTSPAQVYFNHPMWNETDSLYTPNQAESILILGNAVVSNTEQKSFMMRLHSSTLGEAFCDFATDANHGTTRHWKALSCFAVDNVNSPTYYGLGFCGEPGATPGDIEVAYADFFIISLLPASGPQHHSVTITDTLSSTENLASSGALFVESTDNLEITESLSTIVGTTNPGVIPDVRPRLWFYNNDRLAYLQTQKAGVSAAWTAFLAMKANNYAAGEAGGWSYALRYLVDPTDTTSRDAALQIASDMVNLTNGWNIGVIMGDDGLASRDALRSAALIYDWLYDDLDSFEPGLKQKLQDFMLGIVSVCLNNYNNAITDAIFHTGDWATNNPYQNYFGQFQLGATYVGLTLYHNQPLTWGWPPGDSVRHQFWLPYDTRAYAAGTDTRTFTDLWEYAHTRYEEMAFPVWDNELDGGAWVEGSNYGRAMCRHICEAMNIINGTAGLDWIKTKSWLREIITHELYTEMPGRTSMAQYGEYGAGDVSTRVNGFNRAMMLFLIDALRIVAEGRYGQYWLENEVTASTGIDSMKAWDFFLYDDRTTAVNYTSILPPYYYAAGAGYIYSLSAWGAAGIAVMFNAHDQYANHKDRDNCMIHIYNGAISGIDAPYKWMLTDAGAIEATNARNSHYHNTYVIGGQGQRSRVEESHPGSPDSGTIERYFSNSAYSYAQGDISDGYWIPYKASTSHGTYKMTDALTREFFHLRALGVVVAFDRISILDTYADDTTIECHWQFPYDQPIGQGGNIYMHDLGDSRIFYKQFRILPNDWAVPFLNTFEELSGLYTYRHTVQLNPNYNGSLYERDHIYMTAFELTTTAAPTMTAMHAVSFISNTYGVTPVNCDGICIYVAGGSTTYSIIFATDIDAASPTTLSYRSGVLATTIHYVCNLDPTKKYTVTNVTNVITVTEDVSGAYTPNAGGIIEFDPASLAATPDHSASVTDTLDVGESAVAAVTGHAAFITDVIGATENFNAGDIALNTDVANVSESLLYGIGVKKSDVVRVYDSIATVTQTAHFDYVEKTINDTLTNLIPNEDMGKSFWQGEPDDIDYADKLASDDDSEFVRASGYSARNARLYVGLTSPGGYVSRVNTLKLVARLREVVLNNTLELKLKVRLMDAGLVTIYDSFTINLFDLSTPTTDETLAQEVFITSSQAAAMIAEISLTAKTWGSPEVELSQLYFVPTGDIAEKEI